MTRPRKVAVWLVLAVFALSAAEGGCGRESGTDRPPAKQPKPNNNATAGGGQVGQPNPREADPAPHTSPSSNAATRELFITVSYDGDRQMTVTVKIDGNSSHFYARPKGATTAETFPMLARVGSYVVATSTPTLDAKRKGPNQIWVKTGSEQMVCISDIASVGSAQCGGTVPPK